MELTKEQKMYTEVVQKAWDDEKFKKDLLSNPVETIENFIGHRIVVPQGHRLVVKDQTDEFTIYLNIPKQVNFDNLQLTDEQLEQVAGGLTPVIVVTAGLVAGGVCIGEAIGKMLD